MKDKLLLLSGLLIVVLMSCHKDNTTAKNPTLTIDTTGAQHPVYSTDGFGASTKPLSGKAYSFPAGVTMTGSIMTNANSCTGGAYYECVTDGDLPFYMTLQNSNSTATMVIFPAGIVIPTIDTALQGAVIVQPDTIIIPPTSGICVNLNAHCLNEHRTFNNNIAYGNMLISNNDKLTPLIQLLATKKPISYDNNQTIQQAVWDIANTGALTSADIAAINTFP